MSETKIEISIQSESDSEPETNTELDSSSIAASSSSLVSEIVANEEPKETDVAKLMEQMGLEVLKPVGCDHDGNCMCTMLGNYFESLETE